jgi:hypothetical protein
MRNLVLLCLLGSLAATAQETTTTRNKTTTFVQLIDNWWRHLPNTGVSNCGARRYRQLAINGNLSLEEQFKACTLLCTEPCVAWQLIKVTPTSGMHVPQCLLYNELGLNGSVYQPDSNTEMGSLQPLENPKPESCYDMGIYWCDKTNCIPPDQRPTGPCPTVYIRPAKCPANSGSIHLPTWLQRHLD